MPKREATASGDLEAKLNEENQSAPENRVVALSCVKKPTGWV